VTYNVFGGTLNPTQSVSKSLLPGIIIANCGLYVDSSI